MSRNGIRLLLEMEFNVISLARYLIAVHFVQRLSRDCDIGTIKRRRKEHLKVKGLGLLMLCLGQVKIYICYFLRLPYQLSFLLCN